MIDWFPQESQWYTFLMAGKKLKEMKETKMMRIKIFTMTSGLGMKQCDVDAEDLIRRRPHTTYALLAVLVVLQ